MNDNPEPAAIDAGSFWKTLGERPIGATVVTATGDDGPVGFLGLSAAHVSADPPTMLVSIGHKTGALASVLARRHFAVNFLPTGSTALAEAFGGRAGADARFVEGDWETLVTGAPVLKTALGAFDCRVEGLVERPGTSIVIGAVLAARARGQGAPLIFFRGKFLDG